MAAWAQAPAGILVAPILTLASGVPMDILMPDAQSRIPVFQRNAGGRQFKTGAELNAALTALNAAGGIDGEPLPLVRDDVRFGDGFSSLDLRVSRPFALGRRARRADRRGLQRVQRHEHPGRQREELLGLSPTCWCATARTRPNPGYLRSSSFGQAVNTAGGVFGSGGPRAFQFAVRATF